MLLTLGLFFAFLIIIGIINLREDPEDKSKRLRAEEKHRLAMEEKRIELAEREAKLHQRIIYGDPPEL